MDMEIDTGLSSAPYGHACGNCSRSKCKCVNWNSASGCERCRRLGRECRPATRVRKPKPLSRTAQLERTVNQLVALLKPDDQRLLTLNTTPTGLSGSDEHCQQETAGEGTPPSAGEHTPNPNTSSTDDEILSSFCTEKLPSFPFLHFQASVKASEFQKKYPILWHCITRIQSKSEPQSKASSKELCELFGRKLLVNNEKNLDILYGLLAYTAWIAYQCPSGKASLGMYAQLVIGLVLELGLNKPPPSDTAAALDNCSAMAYNPRFKSPVMMERTMDQRRTVLASFIICACISQLSGRDHTLQWTPHMNECRNILTEVNETLGDNVLVQLASSWLIVNQVFHERRIEDTHVDRAPLSFRIKAFEPQLTELTAQISTVVHDNVSIALHCLHAKICLYSSALQTPAEKKSDCPDISHLDYLYTCLRAVKDFFDLLLSIPPAAFVNLTLPTFVQISHSLNCLFLLSIFDAPGWDRMVVRTVVDLPLVADRLALQLRHVIQFTDMPLKDHDSDDNFFTASATVINELRAAWASCIVGGEERARNTPGEAPLTNISTAATGNVGIGGTDNSLSWLESFWLTDTMFPNDMQ